MTTEPTIYRINVRHFDILLAEVERLNVKADRCRCPRAVITDPAANQVINYVRDIETGHRQIDKRLEELARNL